MDWEGVLYCGIKLAWNKDNSKVDLAMPGYIEKLPHNINIHLKRRNMFHIHTVLFHMEIKVNNQLLHMIQAKLWGKKTKQKSNK